MEPGEKIFTKIFKDTKDCSKDERKNKIATHISNFVQLKVSFKKFKKIFDKLNKIKENDKAKDYFNTIKKTIYPDKNPEELNDMSLSKLIEMTSQDLKSAEENIQKMEKLNPFISFLQGECNVSEDITDFIETINKLQNGQCKVNETSNLNEDVIRFITLVEKFNLPSNVFHRIAIKELIDNDTSAKDFINAISDINKKCKDKINMDYFKNMKVTDFQSEIINKAQKVIDENKNNFPNGDKDNSDTVYKLIESNYLEFAELSDDDKEYLHIAVIRVLHFAYFQDVSEFFIKVLDAEEDKFENVDCFINPIKKDVPLIKEFQEFKMRKKDLSSNNLEVFMKKKWPSIPNSSIKIEQASYFFTFWVCISKLLSPFLNEENNESTLVPKMNSFLKDQNKYKQFQQKMQQAYIQPTLQNNYIIFESIMKMLKYSDISNKETSFDKVSTNALKFFNGNSLESIKILNGVDPLIKNENNLINYLEVDEANAIINEYGYVEKVVNGQSTWEISFENRIRLMNKDKVEADFPKLRLIAARLNIVMIKTNNQTNSENYTNSEQFVNFFQTAESLYSKLSFLHKLKFGIAEKTFKYENIQPDDMKKLIDNLDLIIEAVDQTFAEIYKGDICIFTKEQFFALYRLFNQYIKKKENGKTSDLASIFAGTIISSYHDNYFDLITENEFESFNLGNNINRDQVAQFKENLINFSQTLNEIIQKLRKDWQKQYGDYFGQLKNSENLINYLKGGTVRLICLYPNTNKNGPEEIECSSKYQLHSMILYLLYRYEEKFDLPLPAQLLLCSMTITRSQIDSFLEYFYSTIKKQSKTNEKQSKTNEKQSKTMFIIVSPIQLQPDLYDYLITNLKKINETTVSQSRIVILYENEDYNKSSRFNKITQDFSFDHFKPVTGTECLKGLYKIQGFFGIQAYYIYQQFPRTGKTHQILKHIYSNYPDHIYTRILVDEGTSLTTIINRLNAIPKATDAKKIIIHFNVDGKCNTNFHLYIQNLAFFRSLSDGVSVPFVANDQMVFYFEFGSRPSFDKNQFIQNIFPIAKYIEEITIPEAREFFSYDEYITKSHKSIPDALEISFKPNNRKYLITAATFAQLGYDEKSFLKVDKSALHVKYEDYLKYYNYYYNQLKSNPKKAYDFLLKMFEIKENENLLISQINDVAKVISNFQGPILSNTVYENEKAVGYNVRRFLVGLLIEAAVTNCGLPYMPPMEGNRIIDSSENDEQRLERIKKYISRNGHMLAICDPAGSINDQSFALIIDEADDFIELLHKLKYLSDDVYNNRKQNDNKKKIDDLKVSMREALNIVDPDWKQQEYPDELFKILANILNLYKYEREKCFITMTVDIWRSLSYESRGELAKEWKTYIQEVKQNALTTHKIVYHPKVYEIYKDPRNKDLDYVRRKKIWFDVQDHLLNANLFDINENENRQNDNGTIFVSNDIYQFISNCEKYIQDKDSLMLKYTLTSQNIKRFVHLVYRIYSNVPIVLMGETGSGKTFTLKFLSEIIGKNVELIHHVIDGGTKEEALREFLRAKIADLTKTRSQILKDKLKEESEDPGAEPIIKKTIKYLIKDENVCLSDFDDIKRLVDEYIHTLRQDELSKLDISNHHETKKLKGHIMYNMNRIYQEIEKEQKTYLFFFDEVNTAPCQWFIKEIILDRYFEGKILPEYIHFVCAVNPSRRLNENLGYNALDALTLKVDDSQDDRKNLVYKVGQMPESFVPYLFPADPNREYGSYNEPKKQRNEDNLFNINLNSEFDVSIDKKVESEFSLMTYKYNNKKDASKPGKDIHFSATDMFCTSFDYSFFLPLFGDSQEALKFSRVLTRVLSRINIFCCRLSYHEIYKDVSFSSIRDPERCIQIMRWAYKFGIFEKLRDNLNLVDAMERLRRAFIIGLSVSFYIRLSDQKPSPDRDSHRRFFILNVCKYWQKLLDNLEGADLIRDNFRAPDYTEWTEIINKECEKYVNLFVDDDECVSKNQALSENIWVSFICIMNNIPLWIIGKPGTSKSLALNIVINKLMIKNSRNEKITKCPNIVSQTFMCSKSTTTETIMDQLGKIVDRSNMYDDNYIIRIQILEEIGHADMSRFKPLVCLHNIIDNGYPFRPGESIPVLLIGLSNYKMDSAKLNRGILLLRCALDSKAIQRTASEIFKSTNLALHQDDPNYDPDDDRDKIDEYDPKIKKIGESYQEMYNNSRDATEQPFIGLRDFYGLIHSLTNSITSDSFSDSNVLTVVRRNFSGIPFDKELNNPKTKEIIKAIMDALFDKEYNNTRLNKLLLLRDQSNKSSSKVEDSDKKKVTVYYNMSQLIGNNLNQEHRLLKTPIFRHILISTVNAAALLILVQNKSIQLSNYRSDSPYELFFANNMSNLPDSEWISNELRRLTEIMYQGRIAVFIGKHPCFDSLYDIFNLRYQKEGENIFVAMISYGGDSYPTIVNSNFKAIIILESDVYQSLPQPFLNRFEKFNMIYKTELLPSEIAESKENLKSIKRKVQVSDLSSVFGCYSDELILSVKHMVSANNLKLDPLELMLLSIRPSTLVYASKNDKSFSDELFDSFRDNPYIHSTLAHLLYGYSVRSDLHTGEVSRFFYKTWTKNKGIKSIVMLPSFNNIEKITGYDFIRIDSSNSVDIENQIKIQVEDIKTNKNPIVISILIKQNKLTIDTILQYEFVLESIKHWCTTSRMKINRPIHTLILISLEHNIEGLKINQSIEWPLLYLDTCYDDTIATKNNNGLPLDLSQILFNPIRTLVGNEKEKDDDDAEEPLIDIDELIERARKSLIPSYSEKENEMIDQHLFNHKHTRNCFIKDPIIKLISDKKEEENQTALEFITDQYTDLWSFRQITLLSSPPSSIIEFLSMKLTKVFADIMGIIFELLLSGFNNTKEAFQNTDIFYYMMERSEFLDLFFWILNGDSNRVFPIDRRFIFDMDIPGTFSLYKFIWQLATNTNNIENFNEPPGLRDRMKEVLFNDKDYDADTTVIENKFDKLMKAKLDWKPGSLCFQFIAAFLLSSEDTVRVAETRRDEFINWVSVFIKLLEIFQPQDSELTIQTLLFQLTKSKELVSFAHDFTTIFMFFPEPDLDNDETLTDFVKGIFPKKAGKRLLKEFSENAENIPDSALLSKAKAYMMMFISKNFSDTVNRRKIRLQNINDLFTNEFTTFVAIHNSLRLDEDVGEIYEYSRFSFLAAIQQFFIKYGELLSIEKEERVEFTLSTDYSEYKDGSKAIKEFVNSVYKYLKFGENVIDKNRVISLINMHYIEMFYQVYEGTVDEDVDADDEANEEEEEEEEVKEEEEEKPKKKKRSRRSEE